MRYARKSLIVSLCAVATALLFAQSSFKVGPADSYPSHQSLGKLKIAAVKYESDEETKQAFGKVNPNEYGFLPVYLVFENTGDTTLLLDKMRVVYQYPFLFGDGTMFSSDGRKLTASTNPPALITALYDAWTAPTGELFIGGNLGYVYKYTVTGGWVSMKAATITASVFAVGGADANDVYVGTSAGNIYRYQNGVLPSGALNGTAYTGAIQSIWARSRTEVWAAGSNGNVIKYTGTGSPSLVTVPAGITNLYAIHGPAAPSSHVWAVGAGGLILRFDGTTWSKISTTVSTDLYSVVALSESDVWMAGDVGVLLHWDGTSVKQVQGPFGARSLSKLHSPGGTDLWLVGEGGSIWRY